ncbi:MAG: DNA-processing protein DprA [Candidatus Limnocylindria bacterium]
MGATKKKMATDERATLLALCTLPHIDWSFLAREAQRPGGIVRLIASEPVEATPEARRCVQIIRDGKIDVRAMARNIAQWRARGLRLVTVLDDEFPVNLRRIANLPPFLFYRGEMRADDALSVAVVGTRRPTAEGLRRARRMSRNLVRHGVTVLSGLARGIDTAAHEAALEAGGRTIAVLGSGLDQIYPRENSALAERIAGSGAVVSQFWPDAPPAAYNFPRRNVVMSGLGQGTIVIEASATSGAKMQARLAMEHGKQVFLIASLVAEYEWAATYARRGAIVVDDVRGVIRALRPVEAVRDATQERFQLTMQLA